PRLMLLVARADAERVAVGVAEVELAHSPGLVRGRPGDGQPLPQGEGVGRVHLGGRPEPPAHPDASGVVIPGVPGHRAAARTLAVLAEEDLDRAAADSPEGRRVAPVPLLLPAELFEPGEALGEVRDVEDRRDVLDVHGLLLSGWRRGKG